MRRAEQRAKYKEWLAKKLEGTKDLRDAQGYPLGNDALLYAFGVEPGGHIPPEGLDVAAVGNVQVFALSKYRVQPNRYKRGSRPHRLMAECPDCLEWMSAGRLASQHQKWCQQYRDRTDGGKAGERWSR